MHKNEEMDLKKLVDLWPIISDGIDIHCLFHFLEQIDSPGDGNLTGLLIVTRKTKYFLRFWGWNENEEKRLSPIIEVILRNRQKLLKEIGNHLNRPLYKVKISNPLYDIFFHKPKRSCRKQYLVLFRHVVSSFFARKEREHNQTTLYAGFRHLRALAGNEIKVSPLDKLEIGDDSFEVAVMLRDLANKIEVPRIKNHLSGLAIYIGEPRGAREFNIRHGERAPHEPEDGNGDYPSGHAFHVNHYMMHPHPDAWIDSEVEIFSQDWFVDDEDLNENGEDYGLCRAALFSGKLAQCNKKFAARIIKRALGHQAQFFALRRNLLTAHEASWLLGNASLFLKENPELGLVLYFMFLRGMNLTTICQIMIIEDESQLEVNKPCLILARQQAFFPIIRPVRQRDESSPLETHYETTLPKLLWLFVKLLPSVSMEKQKLFSREIFSYQNLLQKQLKLINDKQGLYFSMGKIQRYFWHIGRSRGVDDVYLAQLSADLSYKTNPKMAYTRISSGDLNLVYNLILESYPRVGRINMVLHQKTTTHISKPTDCIGDEKAMTRGEVRAFFGSLIAQYEAIKAEPANSTKFARLFNLYTSYALVVLGFTTAYRGNNNPIRNIHALDPERNIINLTDKNTRFEYRSRTVYAPKVLLDQIEQYDQVRNRALLKCTPFDLDGWQAFNDDVDSDCRWGGIRKEDVDGAKGIQTPCFPFFFFIDPASRKIKSIKMGEWVRCVNHPRFYKDSGRHFIRSQLVSAQYFCPPEIVNAFLGHWERGAESYGSTSCLSPALVHQNIKPHIDRLISDVGIVVLRP